MPRIDKELVRINGAYTPPPTVQAMKRNKRKSLFTEIVARLTLAGQVIAKVEYANALLVGTVELLYDVDVDNEFANIDIDGRVIVPLPWGSAGCYKWNVRRTDARTLRYVMLQRAKVGHAWITYNYDTRGWYVAQFNSRHAYAMLDAAPITNEEWRKAWAATRSAWATEHEAQG